VVITSSMDEISKYIDYDYSYIVRRKNPSWCISCPRNWNGLFKIIPIRK
jgi:hypothetical protein